jgi:hypothetical protein
MQRQPIKMGLKTARSKPDTFDANQDFVELQGTSYAFQNDVMYDTLTGSRVNHATTYNRGDSVFLIVGDRGFSRTGKFLGRLDLKNGNELIPGTNVDVTPAPKAPAPKKAAKPAADPKPVPALEQEAGGELLE